MRLAMFISNLHVSHPQENAVGEAGELEQFWTAARHPKDPNLALAAAGTSVQLMDLQVQLVWGHTTAKSLAVMPFVWVTQLAKCMHVPHVSALAPGALSSLGLMSTV